MLHYGIVGKVGEGGMGRVYKAEGHETRLNDYPAPVVAWKVHAAIARLESKSGDATSAANTRRARVKSSIPSVRTSRTKNCATTSSPPRTPRSKSKPQRSTRVTSNYDFAFFVPLCGLKLADAGDVRAGTDAGSQGGGIVLNV